jgi:dTMP kinase
MANGIKSKWLENLDVGLPKADLVILLDVTQKESFSRTPQNKIGGKKMKRDKFEKNKEFSRNISKIYRTVAKKKYWKIIDATKTKQEVHEEILKLFSKKIGI